MNTYETSAMVGDDGRVAIAGVPFAPGTEVEITINPKRRAAHDFIASWRRVCAELRGRPSLKNVTDEEIRDEIDSFRAGG